jgi:hypothetical protein
MIDRATARMPGTALHLRLAGEPLDELSQERIARAALLLRSICPNDGDIEIQLHEMARTLERIAGVRHLCCREAHDPGPERRSRDQARA